MSQPTDSDPSTSVAEDVVRLSQESAAETTPSTSDPSLESGEGAAADNAGDSASASSSSAQAGIRTDTVVTITKTVTSTTYSGEGDQGEVESTSTTSQEFEPKDPEEDDFIQDLVSMGWTARGRPTNPSATVPQRPPPPPPPKRT